MVVINGGRFSSPVEALEDGQTFSSVVEAWQKVVRPNIILLDELYVNTAAQLFKEAKEAAANARITVRVNREDKNTHKMVPAKGAVVVASSQSATQGFCLGLIARALVIGTIKERQSFIEALTKKEMLGLKREKEKQKLLPRE